MSAILTPQANRQVIPQIAEDELDPFEYRLLGHYQRVAVDRLVPESIRDTARRCQASVNATRAARLRLVEKRYITLQEFENSDYRAGQTAVVELIDRWSDNEVCYPSQAVSILLQLEDTAVLKMTQRVSELMQAVSEMTQQTSILTPEPVLNLTRRESNTNTDKDTNISTPNGALVGASQTPSGRPRNPWYDCVNTTWGYAGSLNGEMVNMLQGKATQKGFKEFNLPEHIKLTPVDVLNWKDWYRHTVLHDNPAMNMLAGRMEIASSIEQWHNLGRPTVDNTLYDAHGTALPNTPMSKVLAGLDIPNLRRSAVQQ